MKYEKPEALELGAVYEVVLGQKGLRSEESGNLSIINPHTVFDE